MSQLVHAPSILVVDDDRGIRETLASCLESSRHRAARASSVAEARTAMRTNPALRVMVADLGLPDGSGLDLIGEFIREGEHRAVIVITGNTEERNIVTAMQLGAMEVAVKPFDSTVIRRQVARALEQNRRLKRITRGREKMAAKRREFLIGKSPAMIDVKKEIGLAARSLAPVLICGEPGTERVAVAQAMHAYGPRAKEPFLIVECRRMTAEAVEEKLLTSASGGSARDGGGEGHRLKPQGTVLLNDVEFLAAGTQCKLLDAIERAAADPGRKPPRIISATSFSPKSIIEKGSLCEDIIFQLAGIEIDIPPLRLRSSDIPLIIDEALREPERTGHRTIRIHASAMEILKRYEWPGNVKELERFVARAVTLNGRGMIGLEDIPRYMKSPPHTMSMDSVISSDSQPPPLRELERRYARSILDYTNGVKTNAARLLNISRGTLEVLLRGPKAKTRKKK